MSVSAPSLLKLRKAQDPVWVAIHRAADRIAPGLEAEFVKALEQLRKLLPLNTLTELIETEQFVELGTLIEALELPDPAGIQRLLLDASTSTRTVIAADFPIRFDVVNPSVLSIIDSPALVTWTNNRVSDLIVGVTQETKKAVTEIVRAGFVEGVAPRVQARQIRRIVGLTARDAGAVDRFLRGQLDAGIAVKRAETLADRMRNRMIRRRAETIARTEGIRAANQGQLQAWREAADEGLLNPSTTRRIWVAADDSRVCPICAVLDGQTIGFDQPFVTNVEAVSFTDNGDSFTIHSTKLLKTPIVEQTPPAHVMCRCAVGLVFDEGTAPGPTPEPAAPPTEPIEDFVTRMEELFEDAKIDFTESQSTDADGNQITILSRIVIPEELRQQGLGTKFMEALIEWADNAEVTVALTPDAAFGGNKARLQEFYRRFGFVSNKGRNKDFAIRETMYRTPKQV